MSSKHAPRHRKGSHKYHERRVPAPGVADFLVTPSENPGNIRVIHNTPFPAGIHGATVRAYQQPGNLLRLEQPITEHESSLHLIPSVDYEILIRYGPDRFPQSAFFSYGVLTAEPE